MAGRPVFLDPCDGGRHGVTQQRLAVTAGNDALETRNRHPAIPTQKDADELASISALGAQVAGERCEQARYLTGPGRLAEARRAHPEVLLDDVGVDDGALKVKHGHDIRALWKRLLHPLRRRGTHRECASERRDGREVHALEVVLPVDRGHVESGVVSGRGRERIAEGTKLPIVEDDLGLYIGAIQLGKVAQRLEIAATGRDLRDLRAGAGRRWESFEQLFSPIIPALLAPQGTLHLAVPRETPGGNAHLAFAGVRHRVRGEELLHVLQHAMDRQRVARAGAHMHVLGDRGGARGDRNDRIDHEVHRDHVEHAVGEPGELGKKSTAVGEDERIGHLEAVDPAGERMPQRALDNRGANHGQAMADIPPQLLGCALGECLGECVDIGPAEALCARSTVVNETGMHPFHPRRLASPCDGLWTLLAVLGTSIPDHATKSLRLA